MTRLLVSLVLWGVVAFASAAGVQAEDGAIGTALIGGKATYYDDGPGLYGAAGPLLREALGGDPAFRGQRVTVCSERCVTVTLVDWCACGERGGIPTIIDLSPEAFRRLAPLSAGVVDVSIELAVELPATDTITHPDPDAGWRVVLLSLIAWRALAFVRMYRTGRTA